MAERPDRELSDEPPYNEILVPLVGSSAAEAAVPVARWLGALAASPLTLVTQVPSQSGRSEAVAYLAAVADGVGRLDTSHVVVEAGRAADAILECATGRPDALVVMETHGRSPLGQLVLGSVSVEVVRRSSIPVVLVGPAAREPRQEGGVTRVIVCLDGNESAERALGPARRAARSFGTPLTLVQVQQRDATRSSHGDVSETGYLRSVAERLGDDLVVDWEVVTSETPVGGIVATIDADANALVVLATSARRLGEQFRHGSVTLDVVAASPAPVLVVGPAVTV